MILGRDIHPDKKIYNTGALVLDVLINATEDKIKYFNLYSLVRAKYDLSVNAFALSLDWLYLLGAIKTHDGEVVKCF